MKKEDKKDISYKIVDLNTGEIVEQGGRTFDFRFTTEYAVIHSLLDRYISRIRQYQPVKIEFSSDDSLWLCFELCKKPIEKSLF